MQNTYSMGHEQGNKRPYLIVYESNNYILGFPLTTKNKKLKPYPSHKNPLINRDNINGEIMIDQLQLINKKDFTKIPSNLLSDTEYKIVIESFVNPKLLKIEKIL